MRLLPCAKISHQQIKEMDYRHLALFVEAFANFSLPELEFVQAFLQARVARFKKPKSPSVLDTFGALFEEKAIDAPVAVTVKVEAPIKVTEALVEDPVKAAEVKVEAPVEVVQVAEPTVKAPAEVKVEAPVEVVQVAAEVKVEAPVEVAKVPVENLVVVGKKGVRWSDLVVTPVSAEVKKSATTAETKNKLKTTPKKRIEKPEFNPQGQTPKKVSSKTATASTAGTKKAESKRVEPISKPLEKAVTGSAWIGFCGKEGCTCVYSFRDGLNCEDEKGEPRSCANYNDDTDRVMDAVRKDSGQIYDAQLFVRGWTPAKVTWEAARDRLFQELHPLKKSIRQLFVKPAGYAFITFATHEAAAQAQEILLGVPSFFGNDLIVNFATVSSK